MAGDDTPPQLERIRQAIETVVAPLVALDGGRIELLAVRDQVVEVALTLACRGCPGQAQTVRGVILPALQATDPTVREVRIVART